MPYLTADEDDRIFLHSKSCACGGTGRLSPDDAPCEYPHVVALRRDAWELYGRPANIEGFRQAVGVTD